MNYLSNNFFGIAAGAMSVLAFVPYVWAILKGETRPSGASWWTWTLLVFITITSSWAAGAPWQVLILPAWLCFSQFGVALLSLKYGDNNWDVINIACIGLALVGIALWVITGQPLIALGLSIIADFFASVPNFRHIWKNPKQENRTGWTLGWLSAVLEVAAITQWSLAESGWAVYFLFSMTTNFLLVWRTPVKLNRGRIKQFAH